MLFVVLPTTVLIFTILLGEEIKKQTVHAFDLKG